MKYWVYILQSQSTGRFYCGHTDNLERRISQHNDPEYTSTRTTKVLKGPWKIIYTNKRSSRGEAMKLERTIKKRGIGRYIKSLSQSNKNFT
jgi:putative endonuclease